jgi:hypothetical protein
VLAVESVTDPDRIGRLWLRVKFVAASKQAGSWFAFTRLFLLELVSSANQQKAVTELHHEGNGSCCLGGAAALSNEPTTTAPVQPSNVRR